MIYTVYYVVYVDVVSYTNVEGGINSYISVDGCSAMYFLFKLLFFQPYSVA
jgi:hypothetical protein